MKSKFGGVTSPGSARYLVNAGPLEAGKLVLERGARGLALRGRRRPFHRHVELVVRRVAGPGLRRDRASGDDLVVTVAFDDDSIATISYVTDGNRRFPKETFDATAGGRSARSTTSRPHRVVGRRRRAQRSPIKIDKGQQAQLDQFVAAARSGGPMPIPIASLAATTRATLAVNESLATGQPVAL